MAKGGAEGVPTRRSGPATVLMKEGHERYFIAWRGLCLLVSTANLRSASKLEAGDLEGRLEEIKKLEANWDEEKSYEDMTGQGKPPEGGTQMKSQVGRHRKEL